MRFDEDPAFYSRLSEKLEKLMIRIVEALQDTIDVLDFIERDGSVLLWVPEWADNEQSANIVDKVLPDYGERKGWLRTNGAGLDV